MVSAQLLFCAIFQPNLASLSRIKYFDQILHNKQRTVASISKKSKISWTLFKAKGESFPDKNITQQHSEKDYKDNSSPWTALSPSALKPSWTQIFAHWNEMDEDRLTVHRQNLAWDSRWMKLWQPTSSEPSSWSLSTWHTDSNTQGIKSKKIVKSRLSQSACLNSYKEKWLGKFSDESDALSGFGSPPLPPHGWTELTAPYGIHFILCV